MAAGSGGIVIDNMIRAKDIVPIGSLKHEAISTWLSRIRSSMGKEVFIAFTWPKIDQATAIHEISQVNVAVSRAQCVAVIVANPASFQVECKTPRQIQLANVLCRYIEMARSV